MFVRPFFHSRLTFFAMCNTKNEYNKVKQYTISVVLDSTKRSYPIDQNSPLNGAFINSIRTRRKTATARALAGELLANDANFDAAFLVLKKNTQTKVLELPFWHIEQASLQSPCEGYPIYAHDLNWNSCSIDIAPGVTLDAGAVIEITVEYWEQKK